MRKYTEEEERRLRKAAEDIKENEKSMKFKEILDCTIKRAEKEAVSAKNNDYVAMEASLVAQKLRVLRKRFDGMQISRREAVEIFESMQKQGDVK